MSILPVRVMTMARTAFADSLPPRKRQKPRATQMTSVHTMVVELATEVWCRDSNQSTKCRARKIPLTAQRSAVFLSVENSSLRLGLEKNTTGAIRATVHRSR